MEPKFSAYPFTRLPRRSRRDAAQESAGARWIAARPVGERLARLVGCPVVARVASTTTTIDPHAAACEVRIAGASLDVRGSSAAVRRIAQQLLGGPAELAAPRPLGAVEHAIWALVVATALEDLGVVGEVWPCAESAVVAPPRVIELAVTLGRVPLAVWVIAPASLELRAPPPRPPPPWADRTVVDVPVVLGRCAIARDALAGLAPRDVVTLERACELVVLGGMVGLRAAPNAVVAEVVTGYGPRDMSLPDDARVELTVALGTTQLSLRQVFELAIGQIVALGRPLAGPFELRAAGRLVGRGELVDVDGELAVRVVSLES